MLFLQIKLKLIEINIIVLLGDIPGVVTYTPKNTEFGGVISCRPTSLNLEPNMCGTFIFQFQSRQQGKFLEEIYFEIQDSPDAIKFIFM